MSANAERFARIVKERRDALDLNQLEVAAAGGPSNTTQTRVENAQVEVLTRTTARKLDAGLQWEPGSARRAWEGGDPIPLDATDPDIREVRASNLPEAVKRRIIDALQRDHPTTTATSEAG